MMRRQEAQDVACIRPEQELDESAHLLHALHLEREREADLISTAPAIAVGLAVAELGIREGPIRNLALRCGPIDRNGPSAILREGVLLGCARIWTTEASTASSTPPSRDVRVAATEVLAAESAGPRELAESTIPRRGLAAYARASRHGSRRSVGWSGRRRGRWRRRWHGRIWVRTWHTLMIPLIVHVAVAPSFAASAGKRAASTLPPKSSARCWCWCRNDNWLGRGWGWRRRRW
mmetsp:Transcript_93268/g.216777  ORF Transcript_93268/g.216777 Transcript_93268/m.216777 type:complete len:234 (+) Transcript_93268:1470-2171(+)